MRELTSHKVNGLNEALKIEVVDEPGSGGANHRYDITGVNTDTNPSAIAPNGFKSSFARTIIIFQQGPIKESGFNGITSEALLAILEDRHAGFQNGQYASADGQEALDFIRGALSALKRRTEARVARGVEGTHAK